MSSLSLSLYTLSSVAVLIGSFGLFLFFLAIFFAGVLLFVEKFCGLKWKFEVMGRLFVITLEGLFYSCMYCGTHLALADEILSKSFHSRHGTAYLFNKVVNVTEGEKEDRQMLTGRHTVVDIYCVKCGSVLGWKYVVAHGKSEKYKEGKFIIERVKVVDEGSPNNQPSGSDDDGAYSPITQPNGTGAGNDN